MLKLKSNNGHIMHTHMLCVDISSNCHVASTRPRLCSALFVFSADVLRLVLATFMVAYIHSKLTRK